MRRSTDLVRSWCGATAQDGLDEVAALRAEIDTFVQFIEDLIIFLKSSGHSVKAALIRRDLDRLLAPCQDKTAVRARVRPGP